MGAGAVQAAVLEVAAAGGSEVRQLLLTAGQFLYTFDDFLSVLSMDVDSDVIAWRDAAERAGQGQLLLIVAHTDPHRSLADADHSSGQRIAIQGWLPSRKTKSSQPTVLPDRLLMEMAAPTGHDSGAIDISDHLLRIGPIDYRQLANIVKQ